MSTQNNEMIDLLFGEASDVIFDRENNKFDLLAFLRLYLAHLSYEIGRNGTTCTIITNSSSEQKNTAPCSLILSSRVQPVHLVNLRAQLNFWYTFQKGRPCTNKV